MECACLARTLYYAEPLLRIIQVIMDTSHLSLLAKELKAGAVAVGVLAAAVMANYLLSKRKTESKKED